MKSHPAHEYVRTIGSVFAEHRKSGKDPSKIRISHVHEVLGKKYRARPSELYQIVGEGTLFMRSLFNTKGGLTQKDRNFAHQRAVDAVREHCGERGEVYVNGLENIFAKKA